MLMLLMMVMELLELLVQEPLLPLPSYHISTTTYTHTYYDTQPDFINIIHRHVHKYYICNMYVWQLIIHTSTYATRPTQRNAAYDYGWQKTLHLLIVIINTCYRICSNQKQRHHFLRYWLALRLHVGLRILNADDCIKICILSCVPLTMES